MEIQLNKMFKLVKSPDDITDFSVKLCYRCVFSVDGNCKPLKHLQGKIHCVKDNVLYHYEISNLNNNIKII